MESPRLVEYSDTSSGEELIGVRYAPLPKETTDFKSPFKHREKRKEKKLRSKLMKDIYNRRSQSLGTQPRPNCLFQDRDPDFNFPSTPNQDTSFANSYPVTPTSRINNREKMMYTKHVNAPVKFPFEQKWKKASDPTLSESAYIFQTPRKTHVSTFSPPKSPLAPAKQTSNATHSFQYFTPQPYIPIKLNSQKPAVDTLGNDFHDFHIAASSPFISKYSAPRTRRNAKLGCKTLTRQRRRERMRMPLNDATHKPTHSIPDAKPSKIDFAYYKHLGNTAYAQSEYTKAEKYYRQSLDSFSESDDLLLKAKVLGNISAVLIMRGAISEAKSAIIEALKCDPVYIRAYIRLSRIHVLQGHVNDAEQSVRTARAIHSVEKLKNKETEDVTSALGALESEITVFRKAYATAQRFRGELQWKASSEEWNTLLSVAPYYKQGQVEYLTSLLYLWEFQRMIGFCEGILQKSNLPNIIHCDIEVACKALGVTVSVLLARAYQYTNNKLKAKAVLVKLEKLAPLDVQARKWRTLWQRSDELKCEGNDAYSAGDYTSARYKYTQAIRNADNFDVQYITACLCNRAAAAMQLQQFGDALNDCTLALKRDEHYNRAYLRRARCYAALAKYDQAIEDFDAYLKREVDPTQVYHIKMEKEKIVSEREAKERARHTHRRRTFTYKNAKVPKKVVTSLYKLLEVQEHASAKEIRKAYCTLALRYHPDKSNDKSVIEIFKEMTAAYNVLSDPAARAEYDKERRLKRY